MKWLTATLRQQQGEAAKLDAAIAANLTCLCVTARRQEELGYGG